VKIVRATAQIHVTCLVVECVPATVATLAEVRKSRLKWSLGKGQIGQPVTMTEERDKEDVRKEEDAAAAEARRIGGRSGMEGMDEAKRAAAEHGGGESEGFEEAEELLEEQAGHGDAHGDPLRDAGAEETEEGSAVYGEADELEEEW
jgi:hypothetical protein